MEDITEALWGTKVSSGTISNLNQKAYEHIETWRCRLITGEYAYIYMDGVYLKRSWGDEIQNVSVLVAIGVDQNGYREILGTAEGMKEDYESWRTFLVWLKERGLGDAGNHWRSLPRCKVPALHCPFLPECLFGSTQREDARSCAKAKQVAEKLREMKLGKAAQKAEDSIEKTLTFMDFPSQHWTRIRTNNMLERVNREIKRRTRAIGAFPDGNSALMLVCARLRHVAGSTWGEKRYMNMDHLLEIDAQSHTLAG